jgi:phosphoglycerol transferase MdoB-like AlkP superfamily enzyme
MKQEKLLKTTHLFFLTGIQVSLLIFLMEWVYRGSFSNTVIWLREYIRPFIYNFLLLFLLFGSLRIFRRRLWILFSFILSLVFLFLALACNVKQEIRGEPVLPADLLLGAEARNMASFFSGSLMIGLVIGLILLVIVVSLIVYKVPNQKKITINRLATAFLLLVFFFITINFERSEEGTFLKKAGNIHSNFWDQKDTYQKNGVLASFVLNMKWLTQEVPENYSKKTINAITDNLEQLSYEQTEKPNIIMIMSEAFWDPTSLENVKYNLDPIPFFHKLQREQTVGNLTVPVFGGSTANTEFEALTGMSTQFLPYGSVPYLHYVRKPIPALPYILSGYGYDTTAIHTWHHWFYNRTEVYRNFGFDRFISIEFLENPIPDNAFVHDKTITDEIVKKLKTNSGNPNFIFAVTTQNHGPYSETEKKPYATIQVTSNAKQDGLSKGSRNMLEYYADNLVEADKELKRLIDEVEKMDQKTMVVFFGDHLPLLGNDYKVYRQTGFYKEDKSFDEYTKMYTTPLIIWDNYTSNKENLTIGSSLLAPIILDRAGLSGSYLTDYLFQNYRKGLISKVPRSDFLASINMSEKIIEEINLLQYDMLFGKMFGLQGQKISPNKYYRLGYSEPIIEQISDRGMEGKNWLILEGANFTGSSEVYVNGELVHKKTVDGGMIMIPANGLSGNLEIKIIIPDSNGKILAQSKPVSISK